MTILFVSNLDNSSLAWAKKLRCTAYHVGHDSLALKKRLNYATANNLPIISIGALAHKQLSILDIDHFTLPEDLKMDSFDMELLLEAAADYCNGCSTENALTYE